ncbi:YeeE/YedE family protein [Bacteroidota bacterium]
MSNNNHPKKIGLYISISISTLIIVLVLSILKQLWFLTALPIGFLFGFFLQKGDLCGASAFSEVLLLKDWKKIWGIWVCIVAGMAGFALLDIFHLVELNPKPFIWLNFIVGGIVFGVGMVLAGGCVSGCLYKSGTGNLNSMIALLGIALGIASVEYGPLQNFYLKIKTFVVPSAEGNAITLGSLAGFPYWLLALLFVLLTLIAAFIFKKRSSSSDEKSGGSFKGLLTARTWKPWKVGLLIGILGSLAYLSSASSGRNYPLGVTHGVLHIQNLITDNNLQHVYQRSNPPQNITKLKQQVTKKAKELNLPKKKVSWWLILLVTGLIAGSWISGRLSGTARLQEKPPAQVITAFIGGLLVGIGAAIARGCVVGNIFSGWALMSVGTILFGIAVILTNWLTTYFYLMGGTVLGLFTKSRNSK